MNISKYACAFLFIATSTSSLSAQQGESPMPALPADIPKNATIWLEVIDKTPSGQDAVWTAPDGTINEFHQFNDRGRGPKTYSTYHLDSRGIVTFEETKGVDYMKNPVNETFSMKDGTATWKNQAENGHQDKSADRYFVDLDGGPTSSFLLVKALLMNHNKLSLLPGGEARLRELKTITLEANGKKVRATLYAVDGLRFTPSYFWLDDQHNFFAFVEGWWGLVLEGYQSAIVELYKVQEQIRSDRAAELAKLLTHHPKGDLVIENVTLFDSVNAKTVPFQRVTVRDERIISVENESGQATAAKAQIVDGRGKMLLPGLWDMHQHFYPDLAMFDIAYGITTARDLADFPQYVLAFGTPHVALWLFIAYG